MASMFSVSAAAVLVLLLGVAVVFLWLLARGLSGSGAKAARTLSRGSWVLAVLLGITGAIGVIADLTTDAVTIDVPMEKPWPLPLEGVTVDTGPTHIDSTGVAIAKLTVSGLSFGARAFWGTGQALSVLMPAMIALLVWFAARNLQGGAPFSATLVRTTRWSAVVVMVAGSLAPVLRGIGGSMASHEALYIRSAGYQGGDGALDLMDVLPRATVFVPFEFWPIGVGIALLALAAILQVGPRLQKETEGLV